MREKECKCGKTAIAKGMCRNCYQRNYCRINYGCKARDKRPIDEVYKLVYNKVSNGKTIKEACKINGVSNINFYRKLTKDQKEALRAEKLKPKTFNYER